MTAPAVPFALPAIPAEVHGFAADRGIAGYVSAVIDLARQAFPTSPIQVSLGQDAEDDDHQYVAIDVEVGPMAQEAILAGQHHWSATLGRVCPSRHAVYFVLGWR